MNWWDVIKATFAADDDWEHFDPDEHDIHDFLAARGRRDMELPPVKPDDTPLTPTAGDIIEDILSTQDEPTGQGGGGPARGPTEDRPARGQSVGLPRPIRKPTTIWSSGPRSEQSRYAGPHKNTPLPPPRESGSSTSHLPRAQPHRFPPEPPTSFVPEDTSRFDELSQAIEDILSRGGRDAPPPEPTVHPGSMMTNPDLMERYHDSPIHLDNESEFQDIQDVIDDETTGHDVAGVTHTGQKYPIGFHDIAAELHEDPDAPTPPWTVDTLDEALRTGKATPEDVEMFINPENPDRPTTRAGIGMDPMTAMELGLPGPWGEGDTDTPTAERRVHIDHDDQIREIMERLEDEDDIDIERIMDPPPIGAEYDLGEPTFTGIPFNEDTGFTMGEPMTPFDMAWDLLKDISHLEHLRESDWDQYMEGVYYEMLNGSSEAADEWIDIQRQDPQGAKELVRQLGLSEEVDDFAAGADAPEEGGVTERIPTNQVAVTTSPSADLEAQATHHGFEFDEHGNLVITGKKPEEKKTGSIMDLTDE